MAMNCTYTSGKQDNRNCLTGESEGLKPLLLEPVNGRGP